MDSGNSGSMQSSSGGDEEYDSRPEPIPAAFLNPSPHFPQISSNPHHHHPLFDPSPSNYLNTFAQSQADPNASSLLNQRDAVWSRALRSDPNCTVDLANIITSSIPSSSSSTQSPILGNSLLGPTSQGPLSNSPSIPPRLVHENDARGSVPSTDQTNPVRNSKKRTRASRRAPTTVLTTDTSNFRAMVQEFTGIPAPPFSSSTPYSRRLDLFSAGSSLKSGTHHLDPLGHIYPLRPSAQKVQTPSPFLNSTMVDAINATAATNNTIATPSCVNYQLPSDHHHQQGNMQSPIIKFQSFLQPPPQPLASPLKYPDVAVFGAKSQGSNSGIAAIEELGMGMSHGHANANLTGLPSQLTSWRDGAGSNIGSSEDRLRPFHGGNYGISSQQVGGCKVNCSAPLSVFHGEKGPENVPSRGEGTVDSWICPSD